MSAANPTFQILYIGLHPLTPIWASTDRIQVAGVARLDFVFQLSPYLGDLFFQALYLARVTNITLLEDLLLPLWQLTKDFSSPTFKRYADHLTFLVQNRIPVIDAENAEEVLRFVSERKIDLILVNSWMLLPKDVVTSVPYGTINIHPSRLPEYRGALPTLWSLKNNDRESAVSFMMLDGGVDGGGILEQTPFQITETDDSLTIEERVDGIIRAHISIILSGYLEGKIVPLPQIGEGSLTGKYERYRKVAWSTESARDILNKILLYPYLEPFCYAYTLYKGKKLYLQKVTATEGVLDQPGAWQIIGLSLHVSARDGVFCARLFKDLSWTDSLNLLIRREGRFEG